jgi:hypothetical protein
MVEPSKIHTSESSDQVILSRNEYEALIGLNHKLQSDNLYLHHELEKLKRMIFGAKSERFVASDTSQLSLELGQSAPSPVEPPTEDITYTPQPNTFHSPATWLILNTAMPAWNFPRAFPVRWS